MHGSIRGLCIMYDPRNLRSESLTGSPPPSSLSSMSYVNNPAANVSQPSMHSASAVSNIEESAEEAFCVQEVPRKGKGLVAVRAIKRGELLLAENPLFTLPSSPSNSTILTALAGCSRDEQQQYFSLCNSHREDLLPAQGIFDSNALLIPSSEPDEQYEGLFLLASRFNSSCAPNVSKCWDPTLQAMLFRTLRDVEEDEELCFNYCDILGTRQQRRDQLLEERNFQCGCDVCELSEEQSKASDDRRTTISRLFEEVANCGKEPTLGMRKVSLYLCPELRCAYSLLDQDCTLSLEGRESYTLRRVVLL